MILFSTHYVCSRIMTRIFHSTGSAAMAMPSPDEHSWNNAFRRPFPPKANLGLDHAMPSRNIAQMGGSSFEL
jgi:hypothetical protein